MVLDQPYNVSGLGTNSDAEFGISTTKYIKATFNLPAIDGLPISQSPRSKALTISGQFYVVQSIGNEVGILIGMKTLASAKAVIELNVDDCGEGTLTVDGVDSVLRYKIYDRWYGDVAIAQRSYNVH